MERNERLNAADKCASIYTNENEARIARKAFMLGCEFEAQGEVIKGVILETEEGKPVSEDLEEEMDRFFEEMPVQEQENIFEDTYQMIARHFYELGKQSKEPVSEDLEDAVEAKGVICKLSDRVWISPVDEEKFHQEVYDRFVVGQTVKIIIVKEDKK